MICLILGARDNPWRCEHEEFGLKLVIYVNGWI